MIEFRFSGRHDRLSDEPLHRLREIDTARVFQSGDGDGDGDGDEARAARSIFAEFREQIDPSGKPILLIKTTRYQGKADAKDGRASDAAGPARAR